MEAQYKQWSRDRSRFNRSLGNPFGEEARQGWQKEYFQGRRPDGTRQQGHLTQLHIRPFEDLDPVSRADAAAPQMAKPTAS